MKPIKPKALCETLYKSASLCDELPIIDKYGKFKKACNTLTQLELSNWVIRELQLCELHNLSHFEILGRNVCSGLQLRIMRLSACSKDAIACKSTFSVDFAPQW